MKEENYIGLPCPEPVIRCRNYIANEKPQSFIVIVDNEGSCENVQRFLGKNNYSSEYVEEERDGKNCFLITATSLNDKGLSGKNSSDSATNVADEKTKNHAKSSDEQKILVIIPTEVFGAGDDFLGTKLMENFLNTLPELNDGLWKVILLNGGVKLSTNDGIALEALKKIENSGVEVLVCSSCLEFYKLTAEKKVGQFTNMLDIITAIDVADKVVRV